MASKRDNRPICVRVPVDIDAAVAHYAAQEGVSKSEWVRQLICLAVNGEPPSMDEGFMQGRALGYRVALLCLRSTFDAAPQPLAIPETPDEAMKLLQGAGVPGRR